MSRRSWNSTLDRGKLRTYTQVVETLTEVVIQDNDVDMYDLIDDRLFDDDSRDNDSNDGASSDNDSDDEDSSNSDSNSSDEDSSSSDSSSSDKDSDESNFSDDDSRESNISDNDELVEVPVGNNNDLMNDNDEFDLVDDDMMIAQDSGATELLIVALEHTLKQHNRVYQPIEDNKIAFAGKGGHRKMIRDFNESECLSNFRSRRKI